LVVEGRAEVYPRLVLICEWDDVAKAVYEATGGQLLTTDFDPLLCNAQPNILNPFFYVLGGLNYF